MKTLMTIAQQNAFLSTNYQLKTIEHKWSCRGYGSSTILDSMSNKIVRVGGCGFDRIGAAIGQFIMINFESEVIKLAKKVSTGRGKNKVIPRKFYGLSVYNGNVRLDGACGLDCMKFILANIGFELIACGSTNKLSQTGIEFFTLQPIDRKSWLFKSVCEA